jgi:hypothetical protein
MQNHFEVELGTFRHLFNKKLHQKILRLMIHQMKQIQQVNHPEVDLVTFRHLLNSAKKNQKYPLQTKP